MVSEVVAQHQPHIYNWKKFINRHNFFITPYISMDMKRLREERDLLLTISDFYVSVIDYPITEAERVAILKYRQELRDLPLNPDKTFPQKPDIIK